jgi:hypothetical protein
MLDLLLRLELGRHTFPYNGPSIVKSKFNGVPFPCNRLNQDIMTSSPQRRPRHAAIRNQLTYLISKFIETRKDDSDIKGDCSSHIVNSISSDCKSNVSRFTEDTSSFVTISTLVFPCWLCQRVQQSSYGNHYIAINGSWYFLFSLSR